MAPRRNRLLFVLVLTAVVGILYLTSSSRAVATHDFYARTRSRLETDGKGASSSGSGSGSSLDKITPQRKTSGGGDDDEIAEAMSRRLMDAEVAAKEMANKKAPTRESVMGDDGGVAGDKDKGKIGKLSGKEGKAEGQKIVTPPKEIVKDSGKGAKDRNVAGRKKYPIEEEKGKVVKEEEKVDDSDEAVTVEMNSILKMSP
ncbi:hypothetical protein V501_09597, partial [Pseudogymnoascus sp. VKM F-4519 (FW-2642)]